MTKSFVDLGHEVEVNSVKAGMSSGKFQEDGVAAKLAGVATEDLVSASAMLNKRLGEAGGGGNAKLVALLQKLKIPLRDTAGQVRTASDVLPDLADAMKNNENAAVRARIGSIAFGKGYATMLPMLVKGGEAFRISAEMARAVRRDPGRRCDQIIRRTR